MKKMMMIKVTTHPYKKTLFPPLIKNQKQKKLFLQYYKPFKKALPPQNISSVQTAKTRLLYYYLPSGSKLPTNRSPLLLT